jgi:acyl-coenzyme A thioesterase PaaI-like protein
MASRPRLRYDRFMPFALKDTIFLRAFSFAKIPLLYASGISVVECDSDVCVMRLPFRRMNKNHLGSMYFGALCIGADAAGGFIAAKLLRELKGGAKGTLIFKDFQAKFLKRPEGDTWFTCRDGARIAEAIETSRMSGQRVDLPVQVVATVPSKFGTEPVAEFVLTLSLKVKQG